MGNSRLNILLIEDDQSSGQSLVTALQRWGHKVTWLKNPAEVERHIQFEEFHLAIVDGMLPTKNGVEVAREIHSATQGLTRILFVSGIFKDKSFIKESLKKVPALGYLIKPVDLEELKGILDSQTQELLPNSKEPVQALMQIAAISNQDKVDAINNTDQVHGFELPWLYTLLVNSNISGVLTLTPESGSDWQITVSSGKIIEIMNNDAKSFFGQLLIEHGYTKQEEIDTVMKLPGNKKIGQRLVDANAISPHVTQLIQSEQLKIRISQSVANTLYKVHFDQKDVAQPDDQANINKLEMTIILNDIVLSKVSTEWIKSYVNSWMEHNLVPTENMERLEDLLLLDALKPFPKIGKIINGKTPIETILSVNAKKEDLLLKAIYFLILERVCVFSANKANKVSQKVRIERLQKILESIAEKTYFEILGVSQNSTLNTINKSYHELAKILHPDKLPQNAHEQVVELTEKIFLKITEAYTTLKHNEKRDLYIRELEIGRSDAIFQAEALYDHGIKCLENRKYVEALKVFEDLKDNTAAPSDSIIYYVWAKIKSGISVNNKREEIEQLNRMVNSIPAEERHSEVYFYTKGLLYMALEYYDKASQAFKNALAINPRFFPPKREQLRIDRIMNTVDEDKISAKTLIMDLDLKALFGGGKKKAK